jgi:hypothetical protein
MISSQRHTTQRATTHHGAPQHSATQRYFINFLRSAQLRVATQHSTPFRVAPLLNATPLF